MVSENNHNMSANIPEIKDHDRNKINGLVDKIINAIAPKEGLLHVLDFLETHPPVSQNSSHIENAIEIAAASAPKIKVIDSDISELRTLPVVQKYIDELQRLEEIRDDITNAPNIVDRESKFEKISQEKSKLIRVFFENRTIPNLVVVPSEGEGSPGIKILGIEEIILGQRTLEEAIQERLDVYKRLGKNAAIDKLHKAIKNEKLTFHSSMEPGRGPQAHQIIIESDDKPALIQLRNAIQTYANDVCALNEKQSAMLLRTSPSDLEKSPEGRYTAAVEKAYKLVIESPPPQLAGILEKWIGKVNAPTVGRNRY